MMKVLDIVLLRFLQTLLVLIVLVVSWQVCSRYVLASPSSFTEELARFLLIWITMLGTVYAYRENAHIGLDLVYEQSTPKVRKYMRIFLHSCIALFSLTVFVGGGAVLVYKTYMLGQTSAVMGVDIAFVYLILPLSGAWSFIYSIAALLSSGTIGEKV